VDVTIATNGLWVEPFSMGFVTNAVADELVASSAQLTKRIRTERREEDSKKTHDEKHRATVKMMEMWPTG
jgi:hypothetical protein